MLRAEDVSGEQGCWWCLLTKSCLTLVTSWTEACPSPLSRQEIEWVAFSSPEDFPYSRIKAAVSCIAGKFFTTEPLGNKAGKSLKFREKCQGE